MRLGACMVLAHLEIPDEKSECLGFLLLQLADQDPNEEVRKEALSTFKAIFGEDGPRSTVLTGKIPQTVTVKKRVFS